MKLAAARLGMTLLSGAASAQPQSLRSASPFRVENTFGNLKDWRRIHNTYYD